MLWNLDILDRSKPEGLPDGSRRSPGVGGRRPPGSSVADVLHPSGGARLVAAEPARAVQAVPVRAGSGTPPGCSAIRRGFPVVVPPFALNDHRRPSANPSGWPSHRPVWATRPHDAPGRSATGLPAPLSSSRGETSSPAWWNESSKSSDRSAMSVAKTVPHRHKLRQERHSLEPRTIAFPARWTPGLAGGMGGASAS